MCGSFDAIHSIHFLCRLPSEEIGGDPFLVRSSLTQYIKSVSDNRATLDFIPIFCGQHAVSSSFISFMKPPVGILLSKFSMISILPLSLIHISEPTRLGMISYAVF